MIDIDIDEEGLRNISVELVVTEAQAVKALNSTLGKMAAWLRGKSTTGLSERLAIQQKVIRRRLRTFRFHRSANGSTITVWYGLDPVAMIYLNARQTKSGVQAEGGRFVKSAFIRKGRNGKKQVFKRRGKERLPLDKQRAEVAEQAQTYIEDSVLGTPEFESRFLQIFEHELQWRMQTQ